MAKYGGGSFALFLVDGYNLLASLSESATISKESITQQTNPFRASSEEHTPVGLTKGMLSVGSGFFDTVTDPLHSALASISHVSRIVVAGIEGNIIGKHYVGFEGVYDQKYEVQDVRDGLTKANVTYQVTGDADDGVIVQNLAPFTADLVPPTGDTPVDYTLDVDNTSIVIVSNTLANPSVVTTATPHRLVTGQTVFIAGVITSNPTINGERVVTVISPTTFSVPVNVTTAGTGGTIVRSNSSNGGVGYLQVTAFSGFTGVIHKIMHSPDDVTYAALVIFTNVTAIGRQRIEVAGNVDRYLSSSIDVTGAGSITPFMGFSRY